MTNVTPLPYVEPESLDAAIGIRVRRLLIGRGTQAELARALGLRQPDVSKRLGGRTPWRASEVATTAALLGVPVGALYGETPSPGGDGVSVVHPPGLEPGTN